MSDLFLLAVIATSIYATVAFVIAADGLINYAVERESCGHSQQMRKSAHQIKFAIVWPVLIPKSPAGHFLEDLWRDMRGRKP